MDSEKIRLWLYLTTKTEISKTKLFRLYKYFNSARAICMASADELKISKILTDDEIKRLIKKDYSGVDELIATLRLNSVRVLTVECEEYPRMLLSIHTPPLCLYCRGSFINLNNFICIASIGSRTPTSYGKKCTYDIVSKLSKAGFIIVSGMAQGIDTISHMAAIDSGFPTVAFIATGVDVIYPKINSDLHRKILKTGMIVSEYVPGTLPRRHYFLERNRLISGVSRGIFISEAAIKSGSAVTVSHATEQNKDIFALPGNITSPLSAEPNRLIKDGAYPVTDADDIINCYAPLYNLNMDLAKCLKAEPEEKIITDEILESNPQEGRKILIPDGLGDEERVLFVLNDSPCDIDTISNFTNISINDLNMMLLTMEIDGKIKSDNGNYYPIK